MTKLILALILLLSFGVLADAQEANSACDCSSYKPLVIDHPPYNIVKKVQPQYPAIARASRAEGLVKVKILIDRKGDVFKACATEGPMLLRAAAEEAALQWKFKPYSGFFKRNKKLKYVQSWSSFNFSLK